MTEVVTSTAASQQLNLLAPRQPVLLLERQGEDSGFNTADIAAANVDSLADTFSQSESAFADQNPVNRHQDEAPKRAPEPVPAQTGPSKARVEIKHIDLGLTPSEVVGTPDILQRFDANGDGRVDLIEAARAGVAREGVFTFAGLASASPQSEEQAAVAQADVAAQFQVAVAPDAAPIVISTDAGGKKIFTAAEAGAGHTKKFFNAVAAQGTPTGQVDAPAKFSGQGVEAVVGKFAVTENTPKFVDKTVPLTKIVVTEDGGETKLYDKVAHTDGQSTGTPADDAGTREQPKAAPAEDAPVVKKPMRTAVAAYTADTSQTTTVVTA